MLSHGRAEKGMTPHLVVTLRPGWRCDPKRLLFVAADGQKVSIERDLPKKARLEYSVPEMARKENDRMSEAEREVARGVLIFFPRKSDPAKYLPVIRSWLCVEKAHLPPEISLPG